MTRKIAKVAIVVALLAVPLAFALSQGRRVTCEVCVSFQGRQICERSSAAERGDAMMQAQNTACSRISSGVTEGIQCNKTPPFSSECSER